MIQFQVKIFIIEKMEKGFLKFKDKKKAFIVWPMLNKERVNELLKRFIPKFNVLGDYFRQEASNTKLGINLFKSSFTRSLFSIGHTIKAFFLSLNFKNPFSIFSMMNILT
jgi:hypothetical protein